MAVHFFSTVSSSDQVRVTRTRLIKVAIVDKIDLKIGDHDHGNETRLAMSLAPHFVPSLFR